MKQDLAQGTVKEIKLCATKDQVADAVTKMGVHGVKLLSVLPTGILTSENYFSYRSFCFVFVLFLFFIHLYILIWI